MPQVLSPFPDPLSMIPKNAAGGSSVSVHVPFYLADGTASPIALTADNKLPFFLANGAAADVVLTT